MLTAILALILIVLILIWRDLDTYSAAIKSATTSEEGNKYLAQINGEISRIHNTILELWACPDCLGSGRPLIPDDAADPPQKCETCKGTGMRPH